MPKGLVFSLFKLKLLWVGAFLFLFFIFFSYLVHENVFTSTDFNTTVRLQDNIGRNWDREFSWFSALGSFETSLIFLLVILVFARKIIAGIVTFFLFGSFHIIELFGKFFVDHPPPPEFLLRTERLMHFPQFHVRADFSYPSGHAGRAAFISLILISLVFADKRLSLPIKIMLIGGIAGYNAVMIVSRVYLGEHWLTDVVGGVLLGAALGAVSGGFMLGKPAAGRKKE